MARIQSPWLDDISPGRADHDPQVSGAYLGNRHEPPEQRRAEPATAPFGNHAQCDELAAGCERQTNDVVPDNRADPDAARGQHDFDRGSGVFRSSRSHDAIVDRGTIEEFRGQLDDYWFQIAF